MIIILISVIMDYGLLIIVRHWIMIIILISVCECKWQRLSLTFRFVNDNDNDYHLQGPQIHRRPRPRALGTGENGIFARAIVCCDGPTLEVWRAKRIVWGVRCEVWGARGVWNCERRSRFAVCDMTCDIGSVEVWGVRQGVWRAKRIVWGAKYEVWSMECEVDSVE